MIWTIVFIFKSLGKRKKAIKDALKEGFKLFLDPEGVWITGEVWPAAYQMKQIAKICEQLARY